MEAKLERISKNPKKKLVVAIVAIIVVTMLALALFAEGGVFAKDKEGLCEVPQNSIFEQAVSGIYYVEGISDVEVYVARGVIMGNPNTYDSLATFSIPPCFTNEPGLQNISNVYLINKNSGERVSLILGVIGQSDFFHEAGESENPLP